MDISVIIVSWNAKQHLDECLRSLAPGTVNHEMEMIVIDNASIDGSPEMVEATHRHVRLIRNSENLGFAKANNIGIRCSRGRYIVLVNSDVRVLGGCLDVLVDCMDNRPDTGIAAPKVLNNDFTFQTNCRRFPSLWRSFCETAGLAKLFPGNGCFSGEEMWHFNHETEQPVDVLKGCFLIVRRTALEQFGLLDESFFIYSEDLDWCKRCWDAGWQVRFLPQAQAIHHHAASSQRETVRFAVELDRSVMKYWAKHHTVTGQIANWSLLSAKHLFRCVCASIGFLLFPTNRARASKRFVTSASGLSMLLRLPFAKPAEQRAKPGPARA